MGGIGDPIKLGSSNRITLGDKFNEIQNGLASYGATSVGTGTNYNLSAMLYAPVLQAGQKFSFIANSPNLGNVTITIGGATANLLDITGRLQLPVGTIREQEIVDIFYDGTQFRFIGSRLLDGWTNLILLGTYVSTASFTVPGDLTSILTKGLKLKLTNGTTKYFYVASATYGAPNTTITVVVSANYTLSNGSAITDIQASSGSPAGFPSNFDFAFSATGFSGTPTAEMQYHIDAGHMYIKCRMITGTSNATSLTMAAPIACVGFVQRQGTTTWGSTDNSVNLTTPSRVYINNASSTIVADKDLSGAVWTASGTKLVNFECLKYPIR